MKRVKFYFTTVSFILSIWSTNLAAQEAHPPISLYYYDDEWKASSSTQGGELNDSASEAGRRILMCVSGADGSRCVLFSLKGGKLQGMKPHRQTFEKLAHPALVTFQRILVGLPVGSYVVTLTSILAAFTTFVNLLQIATSI